MAGLSGNIDHLNPIEVEVEVGLGLSLAKFFYSICSTWFYEKSKNLRVLAITVPEQSQ